ncbi:MAG: dihydropteroate synthase, partial [Alphaproteobacteria bacterium]
SLAVARAGVRAGVGILRVHDVAATVQALALWRAVARAAPS